MLWFVEMSSPRAALFAWLGASVAGCSLLLSNDFTSDDSAEDAGARPDASAEASESGGSTEDGRAGDAPSLSKRDRYRAEIVQDAPIAYYRFAEASGPTAKDELGAYDGTYVGQIVLGQEGPYAGSTAVRFADGNYVDIGALLAHSAWPGITLEGWFLCDVAEHQLFVGFFMTTGENRSYVSRITSGTAEYGDVVSRARSAAPLSTAKWYHVVATIDAANGGRLYVNGALEGSFTTTVRPATVGFATIGVDYDPADGGVVRNNYLVGRAAEVAVYDKGIPEERVVAHYQAAQ